MTTIASLKDGGVLEFRGHKYEIRPPLIDGNEGQVCIDGEGSAYSGHSIEVTPDGLVVKKLMGRSYMLPSPPEAPFPPESPEPAAAPESPGPDSLPTDPSSDNESDVHRKKQRDRR